jgi:hypothetical protein
VEAALTGEAATERGIELKLVTPAQLVKMIMTGEFALQLRIGALLLADCTATSILARWRPGL